MKLAVRTACVQSVFSSVRPRNLAIIGKPVYLRIPISMSLRFRLDFIDAPNGDNGVGG